MKALTLWPEWAYAVQRLGKDGENRTWRLPDSLIGVPVAIHAGVREVQRGAFVTGNERRLAELDAFGATLDWVGVLRDVAVPYRQIEPLRGHIVAIVTFSIPTQNSLSRWAANDGQWFWPFATVKPLAEPVKCKGAQGFWTVPPDVERLIVGQTC